MSSDIYSTSPRNNSLAVTSLVSGIIGWAIWLILLCTNLLIGVITVATMGIGSVLYICTGLVGCISPLAWLAGIITGHIAHNQIRQGGEQGKGMATAGLIMSYIGMGLIVVGICLGVILAATGALNLNQILNQPYGY